MSKTDKTRPWRVRALDKPTYLEAVHDHTLPLPCDLPAVAAWVSPAPTRCSWQPSVEFWHTPANRCGCNLCADTSGRRAKRRRQRRQARTFTRDGWRDEG